MVLDWNLQSTPVLLLMYTACAALASLSWHCASLIAHSNVVHVHTVPKYACKPTCAARSHHKVAISSQCLRLVCRPQLQDMLHALSSICVWQSLCSSHCAVSQGHSCSNVFLQGSLSNQRHPRSQLYRMSRRNSEKLTGT